MRTKKRRRKQTEKGAPVESIDGGSLPFISFQPRPSRFSPRHFFFFPTPPPLPFPNKTAIGRVCEKCAFYCRLQKREKKRKRTRGRSKENSTQPHHDPPQPPPKKKKRRRQVCRLRLLRASRHPRPHLRRVQLREPVRTLRRLRRARSGGRLLLPGVHPAREGREEVFLPFFFFSFFERVFSFCFLCSPNFFSLTHKKRSKQNSGTAAQKSSI